MNKKGILLAVIVALFAMLTRVDAAAGDKTSIVKGVKKGAKFQLHVIAYNVCGLPEYLTTERNLGRMKPRFAYIGERLKKYDIIALQEMFDQNRIIIEKKLARYYVTHGTDTILGGKIGSGVYSFSKFPISATLYNRWRVQEGPDAMSNKGFVAMRVQITDGPEVDVYNLHAQAGGPEWMRPDNYDQLVDGMKYFSFGSGRPIILLGDFNCVKGEYDCNHLFKVTGAEDVFPSAKEVDHILYIENGSGWKVTSLENNVVFQEMPEGKYVSDHTALEATLVFEKVK